MDSWSVWSAWWARCGRPGASWDQARARPWGATEPARATPRGDGVAGWGRRPAAGGLDPTLLEILACPDDKSPVIYQKEGEAERLTCTRCGKRYPVRDGIPVMLIDEATPGPAPSEAEVAAAKALIAEGKPALVGASAAPAFCLPRQPAPGLCSGGWTRGESGGSPDAPERTSALGRRPLLQDGGDRPPGSA